MAAPYASSARRHTPSMTSCSKSPSTAALCLNHIVGDITGPETWTATRGARLPRPGPRPARCRIALDLPLLPGRARRCRSRLRGDDEHAPACGRTHAAPPGPFGSPSVALDGNQGLWVTPLRSPGNPAALHEAEVVAEWPLDDVLHAPCCLFGQRSKCLERARARRDPIGGLQGTHRFAIPRDRSHEDRIGCGSLVQRLQVRGDLGVRTVLEEGPF